MGETTAGPHRLRPVGRGTAWVLGAAAVPMVAVGAAGGVGTYHNLKDALGGSGATALGVVAAGEGATAILALTMLGLTMLGQPSPTPVRLGLWALPLIASTTGAVVATNTAETVVYAMTPLGMVIAAEGLGLLARRLVIYRTGHDVEAERRTAATVRQLAYHRARAENHPDERTRDRSERRSWRLARRAGVGDHRLGTELLAVQRDRLTAGADAALAAMLSVTPPVTAHRDGVTEAVTATDPGPVADPPETPGTASSDTPVTGDHDPVTGTVTPAVTGVTPSPAPPPASLETDPGGEVPAPRTIKVDEVPSQQAGHGSRLEDLPSSTETQEPAQAGVTPVTPPVAEPNTDREPDRAGASVDEPDAPAVTGDRDPVTPPDDVAVTGVTLADIAAVAAVPTPEVGQALTSEQLVVVLRHLRHQTHPPRSYRQAVESFREDGFVGSEARLRGAWADLLNQETGTGGGR